MPTPDLSLFARLASLLRKQKDAWLHRQAMALDFEGFLALVENADVSAVRERLKKSSSLAKCRTGVDEETALMRAVRKGNLECVEALLPLSDVQATDARGSTVLTLASRLGHVECVRVLIAKSELSAIDTGLSLPALGIAASYGHVDCLELLISAQCAQLSLDFYLEGASVQKRTPEQCTALNQFLEHVIQATHRATYSGNADCLALLLKTFDGLLKGDMVSEFEETLLMSVVLGGDVDCLQLVLPLGGVDSTNKQGQTALMMAGVSEEEDCLRLLLSASNVHKKDNAGLRAFDHCLAQKRWGHADLLVSKMSLFEAREVLRLAPAGTHLPNSLAMVEQEELARELALSPSPLGPQESTQCLPGKSAESSQRHRRL